MKPQIKTINGHGILYTEISFYRVKPDEADVQGVDADAPENVMWKPARYDLTANPPVQWNEPRWSTEYVGLTFADGQNPVFRMSVDEFEALYYEWLERQTQYPELN